MSVLSPDGRPVWLRIGRLTVTGASGIEARRLADLLPAALERALSSGPPAPPPRRSGDRVAAQLAHLIAERVRAQT
jgi:hypothetical protein